MREIPLTKGQVALVDDEDYEALSQYKWCTIKAPGTYYAVRRIPAPNKQCGQETAYMHRQILGTAPHKHTHHIDGNGLNNQRANLAACTSLEHAKMRAHQPKHGLYGVRPVRGGTWAASVYHNYRTQHLGTFHHKLLAAEAYNRAALELPGHLAKLNHIDPAELEIARREAAQWKQRQRKSHFDNARAQAIAVLRQHGFTLSDIGRMWSLSRQRVYQIASRQGPIVDFPYRSRKTQAS